MDPFIGQIMMFGGNFAPRGWALCNGQLLSIAQNTALFSILGTTYGGDGRTTFALPDLRGRAPIHAGTGPGLSTRKLGQRSGVEDVVLNHLQMPSHSHIMNVSGLKGAVNIPVNTGEGEEDESNPGAGVLANNGNDRFASEATPNAKYGGQTLPVDVVVGSSTILPSGGSQPHTNMQPYLVVNYIIALEGVFPSRS